MILELKNITLGLSEGKDSFKILDELNLNVPKEKITALIGGNGSGKTTLFNIISGFQRNFSGNIIFNGEDLDKYSPDKIARIGVGRLFQGTPLIQELTLIENILLASSDYSGESPFSYLFKKKEIDLKEKEKKRQAIDILNRLFGKDNKYIKMLDHKGADFSYGEQRLISLARLFMGDYSLLLLDEPTAGVNPVYISAIKDIILMMVESGKSILLIEHNMPFINGIADFCAYLDAGKIAFEGSAKDILNNQDVKNNYLGL